MNTLNLGRYMRSYWLLLGLLLIGAAWLCRPQARVTAQAAEQSFSAPESWARELTREQGWGPEYPRMLADVNGDGRQDVVGFGHDGVWLATSAGASFNPGYALAAFGYKDAWRTEKHVRLTGDINGDGLEDIVGFGDRGVWTALSTGNGFASAQFVLAAYGNLAGGWRVDKHPRLLADVNGDGQKDIVAFGDAGVWVSLATSGGAFSAPAFVVAEFGSNQGWTPAYHPRLTADINGDGRQDIVGFANDGVWIALSTGGGGFGPAQGVLPEFGYLAGGWRVDRHPRLLADMDRDGRADIVGFGDDGVWIARANGSGFDAARFVLANFGYNQGWRVGKQPRFVNGVAQTGCSDSTCKYGVHPRFVADLNGDGYQDIVGFGDEAIYRSLGGPGVLGPITGVLRTLGTAYGHPWNGYEDVVPHWYPRFVGDVTGDGMQDLVAFDAFDIKVVRSSNLPPPPPPAAPSGLQISGKTASSLSLKWKDNSDNERRFFINHGESGESRPRATLGDNTTSFTFSDLDANRQYCFNVQAENLFGVSASTPVVCGRTAPEPKPTPTPTPSPSGFSRINVHNCHSDRRTINIWTLDYTTGAWKHWGPLASQWNGSSCPGSAAPFEVPLTDGHLFRFVAVDPGSSFCGGQNDPLNGGCQRAVTDPVRGFARGPALPRLVN